MALLRQLVGEDAFGAVVTGGQCGCAAAENFGCFGVGPSSRGELSNGKEGVGTGRLSNLILTQRQSLGMFSRHSAIRATGVSRVGAGTFFHRGTVLSKQQLRVWSVEQAQQKMDGHRCSHNCGGLQSAAYVVLHCD